VAGADPLPPRLSKGLLDSAHLEEKQFNQASCETSSADRRRNVLARFMPIKRKLV
jgi:hypothetical protein